MSDLPEFKYHPDPLKTGSVKRRISKCRCCGEQVPYIYVASVYGKEDLHEKICPWCISNGLAHRKFGAFFADPDPLVKAGLSEDIVSEVTERTPGYMTWQQDIWASHCGDACAFLGDATKVTLKSLAPPQRNLIFDGEDFDEKSWVDFLSYYEPGGTPAIYHFRCLKCKVDVFNYDCS